MATRKILSFGLIAVLVAFMATMSPAAATDGLPSEIVGVPIPSQGREGDTTGFFAIENVETTSDRTFTAVATLSFQGPEEPGKAGSIVCTSVPVEGVFQVRGETVALRFISADSTQPFTGLLQGPAGQLWGFFNIPGNGFLTQVFVTEYP